MSPLNGAIYTTIETIAFSGRGVDSEDGEIDGASLVWHSNIDGQLGTGVSIGKSLSIGTHTITLMATAR